MSKIFAVVFLIFGTVVGSGFSSGKEIMVFFTRFGDWSYLYIVLAGILFFLVFYFFLSKGKKIVDIIEKSPILNMVIGFIAVVFCASMFAGIKNLFSYFSLWLYLLLVMVVLVACFFIVRKGIGGLEKINFFLMPITSLLFLIVLIFFLGTTSNYSLSFNSWTGLLFSPLYVALNTCMSGVVISRAGEGLSKKQIVLVCLFVTLLLVGFLLFGNYVLLNNLESYFAEMPFLYLSGESSLVFVLVFIVVLVGCFTTLISLCYTLKSSFDKIVKNKTFSTLLAIFVPFAISVMGFSKIVSFLYPICSAVGICMFVYIFVQLFLLKRCDKSAKNENISKINKRKILNDKKK